MQIETRDFGGMEIDPNEIIRFQEPVYGFEELTEYVLLSDDEAGDGIMWLQSVEKPEVCFVIIDPEMVGTEYKPEIPQATLEQLEVGEMLVVRLIAVVPDNFHDTTVNLKSPVLINPEKKCAAQVILEADYPIRMRLFGEEGEQC